MNRIKLKAELIRDEGKRLVAYKDSLGWWTIGVGHLLGNTRRMAKITEEECSALLEVDIDEAEAGARRLVPLFNAMNDSQKRALVNMVLNRGEQRMRASTKILPAILRASEGLAPWVEVGIAMVGSEWASQVGERATRLADQFTALA